MFPNHPNKELLTELLVNRERERLKATGLDQNQNHTHTHTHTRSPSGSIYDITTILEPIAVEYETLRSQMDNIQIFRDDIKHIIIIIQGRIL